MGRPKKNETVSLVNHPSHYNLDGREECIVEMEEMFGVKNVMIWCYLTAYKYTYRLGNKDGNSVEQDIAKALWYMEYVDKLAEKWHTEPFDIRMRQQLEKAIKDAKRKYRKIRQEEEQEDNGTLVIDDNTDY